MKKQKPKKSPAQIAKEQAEKAAAKTAEWQRECRRLGRAVRFSYLRTIKKVMDCEMEHAQSIFYNAVQSGTIEQTGTAGIEPGTPIYEMKKNFPKSLEDK